MTVKGGQLGTHGDSLREQIFGTGASCAVRLVKMLLFLGRGIDTAPAWHIELAKIGYQTIAQDLLQGNVSSDPSLIRPTAVRLTREMAGPQFLVVF